MRWVLFFLLASGLAWAGLGLPAGAEVDPGGFLSIPVRASPEVTGLKVTLPEGFRLLSPPRLVDGRALVNVLVSPDQRAGRYTLRFSALKGEGVVEQVAFAVQVRPRVELALFLPEGKTVVDGTEVRYPVRVQNKGNAPDRVRLEVSSVLDARIEPDTLDLAPGEVGEAVLVLNAENYRADTATVRAYSTLKPDYFTHRLVKTRILPFAGADRLKGPVLYYRFTLRGGYELDGGFDWGLGLGVGGGLSDFVRGGAGLDVRDGIGGQLSLYGEGWSAGYRYGGLWHRLEGELGPFSAYLSLGTDLDPERAAFGVGYESSLGRLDAAFRPGLLRLFLSRDFALTKTFTLTPQLGVEAPGLSAEKARPSAGLLASYEPKNLTAHASVRAGGAGVNLSLTAASRRQIPFGFKVEAVAGSARLEARGRFNQAPAPAWRLYQQLGFDGSLNALAGVRFRPLASPVGVGAEAGIAGGFWRGAVFANAAEGGLSGFLRLAYAEERQRPEWSLGGGYTFGVLALKGQLEGVPEPSRAKLGFGLNVADWKLGAEAGYDWLEARWRGKGVLAYRFQNQADLALKVGFDRDWSLGVTGKLTLRGGFSTPEGVVRAFGGRATGELFGTVFHDQNRNGVWDVGEPVVPKAEVRLGRDRVRAGEDGRYLIAAYPGVYRLYVGGVDASLALIKAVEARLMQGRRIRLDLPLVTVVGVAGQAWYDGNDNGTWDEGEGPVIYGKVAVRGPSQAVVWTDGRGGFQAGGLLPGDYALSLVGESLEQYQAPAETVRVALKPGPLQRVNLRALPVVREVRQSLARGDLTLKAELGRRRAPPGAEVPLTARAEGAEEVALVYAGRRQPLKGENGVFKGFIEVPEDAKGVLPVEVVARGQDSEKRQKLLLVVRPGTLAQLFLQPAFAAPGERIEVEARFLRRVKGAVLRVGEARYTLDPKETFVFKGGFLAPMAPGSYRVELWAEGRRWAQGRYTVEAP